ncbi:MAG: helix-turn-helix domain-containing protein [Butyricicoccus sp.]
MQIIASLENGGIFLLKGAVKDVADALHCSQASVYRYLSQIKKDDSNSASDNKIKTQTAKPSEILPILPFYFTSL